MNTFYYIIHQLILIINSLLALNEKLEDFLKSNKIALM